MLQFKKILIFEKSITHENWTLYLALVIKRHVTAKWRCTALFSLLHRRCKHIVKKLTCTFIWNATICFTRSIKSSIVASSLCNNSYYKIMTCWNLPKESTYQHIQKVVTNTCRFVYSCAISPAKFLQEST